MNFIIKSLNRNMILVKVTNKEREREIKDFFKEKYLFLIGNVSFNMKIKNVILL